VDPEDGTVARADYICVVWFLFLFLGGVDVENTKTIAWNLLPYRYLPRKAIHLCINSLNL
jgi:hypothetical protein